MDTSTEPTAGTNTQPIASEITAVQSPVVALPAGAVVPTPRNTPVPGGGSWTWNDATLSWQENTQPYAHPVLTPPALT